MLDFKVADDVKSTNEDEGVADMHAAGSQSKCTGSNREDAVDFTVRPALLKCTSDKLLT